MKPSPSLWPARLTLVAMMATACGAPATSPSVSEEAVGSSPPPATATSTESPAPLSASPSASAAAALELTWSEQAIDGVVQDVIVDGDRLVAVGTAAGAPLSWESIGGEPWQPVAVPVPTDVEPEFAAVGSSMGSLARLDETLYSFGSWAMMDFVKPLGWNWTDGANWAYVVSTSPFYESGRVLDVVAGDGALIAARLELGLSWTGAETTMWTWQAGLSWTQGALAASSGARPIVTDVAWDGQRYAATGFASTGNEMAPVGTPLAWTSADGQTWTEIDAPATEGQLCGLEADGLGGFTSLSVGADQVEAWTWREGAGWSSVTLSDVGDPAATSPMIQALCEVIPVADQLLAVVGTEQVQTFTSVDAADWIPGPDLPLTSSPAGFQMAMAGQGDRLVVTTYTTDEFGGVATGSTLHVGVAAP